MPDLLDVTPHPDEQRTYAELREEFRAASLAFVRTNYAGHHPIGWQMIGDYSMARDVFNAEDWCREMLSHLDAPVKQDFGLGNVPLAWSIRLEKQAQAAAAHDSVTWDEGVDQDAPPCDLAGMTDDDLCDYVDRSIKESARG